VAKPRYAAEEIVTVLLQVEVALANGKPTPQALALNPPSKYAITKGIG